MPNASDEAGHHGGKRAAKADTQQPTRTGSDAAAPAAAEDHYVHLTVKKGGEKFWVMAHSANIKKFKAGDSGTKLTDVVDTEDIFIGKQPNRASKTQLSNAFGDDVSNEEIVRKIIAEGAIM